MNGCGEVADPVFVQPHFDDVALSCGGTVASLAAAGRPRIVTVFGGVPEGKSTEFVRFQHERWGLSEVEAVDRRREEDRSAANQLGARVDVVWLDYLDAIYRQPHYASDEALFGSLIPEDRPLAAEIAQELAPLGDVFAVPMAVGKHVDHQLAYLAGKALHRSGKAVWLYADQPYALDPVVFHRRFGELRDPASCRQAISPEQFDRRWRAIECYGSQLPVIFRDYDCPRTQLERFGKRPSEDSIVELSWKLEDVSDE
ncbi:PIG-L family deacetylase [soil metagenome]